MSIQDVAELADISVEHGTTLDSLNLPQAVQVTLSDGSKPSLNVVWDGGTPAYDGNKAGTYVFTGVLELPDGVENPDDLQATVNVIVKAYSGRGGSIVLPPLSTVHPV